MSLDPSLCKIVESIKEDPFKKVDNLTIGTFNALQAHLKSCMKCSDTVDEILEKHKDVPSDSGNGWDKTKYN